MVELRKRPAPAVTEAPPTAKRTAAKGSIRSQVVPSNSARSRAVAEGVVASKGRARKANVSEDRTAGENDGSTTAQDAKDESGNVDGSETRAKSEAGTEVKADENTASTGAAAAVPLGAESIGKTIGSVLDEFGGTVKTHSGEDVTVRQLLEKSEKGIVVFTYPKASTPGCTTQACLFRDSYDPLRAAGLAVYGLSTDSPKANTTFATKQKLPFELLCDPEATLTGALGLKKGVGKGTLRGSVVIGKDGKVESWVQAGPAKTLEVVTEWVEGKK